MEVQYEVQQKGLVVGSVPERKEVLFILLRLKNANSHRRRKGQRGKSNNANSDRYY